MNLVFWKPKRVVKINFRNKDSFLRKETFRYLGGEIDLDEYEKIIEEKQPIFDLRESAMQIYHKTN